MITLSQARLQLLSRYHDCIESQLRNKSCTYKAAYLVYDIIRLLLKYIGYFSSLFLRVTKKEQVDIVVVFDSMIDYQRSKSIWDGLKNKCYRIKPLTLDFTLARLAPLYIRKSPQIPYRIYMWACYAAMIKKQYNPKMLCIYQGCDVWPVFMRHEMQDTGPTVFIPHAIHPPFYLYTCIDFDYYLAFGQSAIDSLKSNTIRIGHTNVILTGSPLIDSSFSLAPNKEKKHLLFFSDWWIEQDIKNTRKNFAILIQWAQKHPEYTVYIKLHPLEKGYYVKEQIRNIPNMIMLPKETSFVDACSTSSAVITSWSVASVEAALLNRPTIVVNHSPYDENSHDYIASDKFLYLEKYFPRRATTAEELDERIQQMMNNFDYYLDNCREFIQYHIEKTTGSQDYVISVLDNILQAKMDNIPTFTLEEKTDGLE